MRASSNSAGSGHFFDVQIYEKIEKIRMHFSGSLHGTIWVHYEDNGQGPVVRAQSAFQVGVDLLNCNPAGLLAELI